MGGGALAFFSFGPKGSAAVELEDSQNANGVDHKRGKSFGEVTPVVWQWQRTDPEGVVISSGREK